MLNKWLDFLFNIAVRLIAGAALGAIASLLICAPIGGGGTGDSRPLLVWVFGDAANPQKPLYWIGGFSFVGGIIGVLTVPWWQRPWYKYEKLRLEKDKPDGDTRLSSLRWTQKLGAAKKGDEDDKNSA